MARSPADDAIDALEPAARAWERARRQGRGRYVGEEGDASAPEPQEEPWPGQLTLTPPPN